MTNQLEKKSVLETLLRALDKSAFVLKENPKQLFPQIYNRLQFQAAKNENVTRILNLVRDNYKKPWLRIVSGDVGLSSALVRNYTGHIKRIHSCILSPDGKKLISSSDDGIIKIWETETGKEISTIVDPSASKQFVTIIEVKKILAINPNGSTFASISGKGEHIKVWDMKTYKELYTIKDHTLKINVYGYTPDGKRIISGCQEGYLRQWDANTGQELAPFKEHPHQVVDFSVNHSCEHIVSACADGILRIFNLENGNEIMPIKGHNKGIKSCAYSPDSRRIVSASFDALKIWNAQTGEEYASTTEHTGISSCIYNPEGTRIITFSINEIKIWDSENFSEIGSLKLGSFDCGQDFILNPDGKYILSAGNGRKHKTIFNMYDGSSLKLIDAESGKLITVFEGHIDDVYSFTFNPNSKQFVSGGEDHTLMLWNIEPIKSKDHIKRHQDEIISCSFDPGGSKIITSSYDKTIKVWDLKKDEEIVRLTGHNDIISCCFSPSGKYILSWSYQEIKLWETKSGREIAHFEHDLKSMTNNTECAFSPDEKKIISINNRKNIKLWDVDSKKLISILEHEEFMNSYVFSRNGKQIITIGGYYNEENPENSWGELKVWNTENGKEISTWKDIKGNVNCCDFSPDEKFLVIGGMFELIIVNFDIKVKRYRMKLIKPNNLDKFKIISSFNLKGEKDIFICGIDGNRKLWNSRMYVDFCRYSPDGKMILSTSNAYDNVIKLWHATDGTLLKSLKGHNEYYIFCSFSPDGKRIVSICEEDIKEIILWDIETGKPLTSIDGLFGKITSFSLNNKGDQIVIGNSLGQVFVLSFENIEIFPVIITSYYRSGVLFFRCPYCMKINQIKEESLGQKINCPSCGEKVKLNPFFTEYP